ncbi:MAG: class I SAM-dependent methyltransferase [Methanophagales archaeon]|nr:class I SAM-dependent methyltransferase [Methanophagales archaeon]
MEQYIIWLFILILGATITAIITGIVTPFFDWLKRILTEASFRKSILSSSRNSSGELESLNGVPLSSYHITRDPLIQNKPFWMKGNCKLNISKGAYVSGKHEVFHPYRKLKYEIIGEIMGDNMTLKEYCKENSNEFFTVVYPNLVARPLNGICIAADWGRDYFFGPMILSEKPLSTRKLNKFIQSLGFADFISETEIDFLPTEEIDYNKTFFSKDYYGKWLQHVVPSFPILRDWEIKQYDVLESIVNGSVNISTILDIGCGTGRHIEFLLEKGVRYCTGIDTTPEMIKEAQHIYKMFGDERVELKLESVENLSFKDESFDMVICMTNTFGNMDPTIRETGIAEIYRVLRKGGFLVLSVYRFSTSLTKVLEESYRKVGLEPYEIKDSSVVRTKEGLCSKMFSEEEISQYLETFENLEYLFENNGALILKATK